MGREGAARQGQRKGDFLAGKYLLEDCLGIGGMGEVYRATNVSLGRKVAIKLLSPEYVNIESDVLRFLREARAAATVRHANVVDVLDVARDDDGTPFIVQELLSGEDLEHYLHVRGGPLSFEEALEIMIPVADAVAAAHSHDVVHRDLKPANIFLSRERNQITPKVLDFGACLFPTIAERSAKEVRMLIGTPHYMAPEQIVSKADVDARSDVWALGVILYEMIVGETPFEGETTNAVLELVKTRDVPPLRESVKNAPSDLEELIASCTKRDRLARLANAGVVYEAMKAVRQRMRGQPNSSRMETVGAMPAQRVPLATPTRTAGGEPEPMQPLKQRRLLTLNSPTSEPPSSMSEFELDIPLPTILDVPRSEPAPLSVRSPLSASPPLSAPPAARAARFEEDLGGAREFDLGAALSAAEAVSGPASWPPPAPAPAPAPERDVDSSMPPVLFARPATSSAASLPPPVAKADIAPLPPAIPRELRESIPESAPSPPSSNQGVARPPAVLARDFPSARTSPADWTLDVTMKFAATIALPAVGGFIAVLAIPALGTPLGGALRGDSTLGSGVLAVLALVCSAALCARVLFGGKRDRYAYLAAAGSVLFGIVMIIVTSSASEAAENGIPASMGGFSSLVAPIAPLALALGALARARGAWTDPYARGESLRFAALASAMLFLTLALSPMGAVRAQTTPPAAPQTAH